MLVKAASCSTTKTRAASTLMRMWKVIYLVMVYLIQILISFLLCEQVGEADTGGDSNTEVRARTVIRRAR
jgi:hypothetical protein